MFKTFASASMVGMASAVDIRGNKNFWEQSTTPIDIIDSDQQQNYPGSYYPRRQYHKYYPQPPSPYDDDHHHHGKSPKKDRKNKKNKSHSKDKKSCSKSQKKSKKSDKHDHTPDHCHSHHSHCHDSHCQDTCTDDKYGCKAPADLTMYATCQIAPNSNDAAGTDVNGTVYFTEDWGSNALRVWGSVYGLSPDNTNGFHVHTWGSTTNSCNSMGPHWNPEGVEHGFYDSAIRHAGDLKQLSPVDGVEPTLYDYTDAMATLWGKDSIIGRGLVVHLMNDDGGQPAGNAGPLIACCTIARANPDEFSANTDD